MTDRIITIDTRDRGALTLTEPAWCIDGHDPEEPAPRARWSLWRPLAGLRRRKPTDRRPDSSEIHHFSEPVDIVINTHEGPIVIGGVQLWQDPFPSPTFPNGAEVYVSAYFADRSVDYPPGPLDDLAAAFIEAAGSIRLAARNLAALTDEGDR